jgi:hypothetical protein
MDALLTSLTIIVRTGVLMLTPIKQKFWFSTRQADTIDLILSLTMYHTPSLVSK